MGTNTERARGRNSFGKLTSRLIRFVDPECNLCPLNEDTNRVCIPVTIPEFDSFPNRLMVVAEAPGYNEEHTGKLLSGKAGQFLWEELERIGLERNTFFISNAVKCRPEDNRTPTDREIRICTDEYLQREVRIIQPKFGLALGNSGIKATLGRKGITKYNGTTYEYGDSTWVAAFHPAAVLRNPRYLDAFRGALLVFKRLVYDEEGIPTTRSIAVNDKKTLGVLIGELKKAKRGSIDVETWSEHKFGGLYPWDKTARLSAINISLKPGLAYVVPLWTEGSRWKDPQKVINILKPHIESGILWYMHNGKFDEKWFHVMGINVRQHFDTMGAIYALDENNRKDLGFASQVYLGAPVYKDLLNKEHTNLTPLDDIVEYGGKDADYTLRLGKKLTTKLKAEPLSERIFYKLLMPSVNALTDIEIRGIPIHRGKFQSRRLETEENVNDQIEILQEFVPSKMKPFNPNSPQQLGKLLFEYLGFPIINVTKTGKPSTAEDVLVRLNSLDESGIIDAIFDYRKWSGYRSRYFDNWAVRMDARGRLHSTFKPFHTVTGRLSSSDPNMQQVPRDTFIRGLIGGRRGWRIVEADYSQMELRIVAHVSRDKTMLRAYHLGRDIHTETAMATTGLTRSEITPEIRKKAKAVNFGFVYGMGFRKFIEYSKTKYDVDVTEIEAKNYQRDFFLNFRELRGWHGRQRRAAKRRKWVISPIGRKRHLWDIDSENEGIRAEAERQAINSPVQSMASDMMLMSMVQLNGELDESVARVIGTVHDSILFEVREEALDDIIPRIVWVMENLPLEKDFECLLTVPIKADVKVGKFWSEGAEDYKGI